MLFWCPIMNDKTYQMPLDYWGQNKKSDHVRLTIVRYIHLKPTLCNNVITFGASNSMTMNIALIFMHLSIIVPTLFVNIKLLWRIF